MTAARLAAAPISWGVCEVPGWGHQLSASRVLAEMREIGLDATELGPEGFLPNDPAAAAALLSTHQLTAVGGFVPLLLHDAAHDALPAIDRLLNTYRATRADVLVVAATTGDDGYSTRPNLDRDGWCTLLANLDRVSAYAVRRGVRAVLHPHVGTMVESPQDVKRVLDGSSVALCLDTGHLLIGGTDPADLARQVCDRIAHTHLKDVDARLAACVQSGRMTYTEAVRAGMYRHLGDGDVDIAAIVHRLEAAGYTGWYTLEQDTILAGEPTGEGPATDVHASVEFIRNLLTASPRR